MTKEELLKFLEYPSVWKYNALFPDELFSIQYEGLLKIFTQEELAEKINRGDTYGPGSEHFRGGSFYYHLNSLYRVNIDSLKKALLKDPDKPMAASLMKYLDGR